MSRMLLTRIAFRPPKLLVEIRYGSPVSASAHSTAVQRLGSRSWGNQVKPLATTSPGFVWVEDGVVAEAERPQPAVHPVPTTEELEDPRGGDRALRDGGPIEPFRFRAFVTLKRGAATPEAAELIAFARSRVGYKAPDSIVVLDQMPLTASHKVDRTALRRLSDQIT